MKTLLLLTAMMLTAGLARAENLQINEAGWYQTDFARTGTMQTEMGCPLAKPVTETIYSKPVFVQSLTNENLNGAILLTLITPSAYQVEVTEVP